MSRYVKKKNGFSIGSDNWFFVSDRPPYATNDPVSQEIRDYFTLPEGVAEMDRTYQSTVSISSLNFKSIDSITVGIRTPAEQLIWPTEHTLTYEREWRGIVFPETIQHMVLRPFVENWLNCEIGPKYLEWDTYTWPVRNRNDTFFFRTRKNALKFVDNMAAMIDHTGYR